MEVSSQLHAPAAFLSERAPGSLWREDWVSPIAVLTLWRGGSMLSLPRIEFRLPVNPAPSLIPVLPELILLKNFWSFAAVFRLRSRTDLLVVLICHEDERLRIIEKWQSRYQRPIQNKAVVMTTSCRHSNTLRLFTLAQTVTLNTADIWGIMREIHSTVLWNYFLIFYSFIQY
jgi:hypothetical protein